MNQTSEPPEVVDDEAAPAKIKPRDIATAFGILAIFCLPIKGLALIGSQVGPLTTDHPAAHTITVKGTTHTLSFNLPDACAEQLGDPTKPSFECERDGVAYLIEVRTQDEIDDATVTAQRAAREILVSRDGLALPTDTRELHGVHVTSVSLPDHVEVDAVANVLIPEGEKSGFSINIGTDASAESPERTSEDVSVISPQIAEELLDSIKIEKKSEGDK